MRILLLALLISLTPQLASASAATKSFESLRTCVMNDDAATCRKYMNYTSYSLFDRFAKYKLIRCLPTNLTIDSEKQNVITASMPGSGNSRQRVKLVFTPDAKLDALASLKMAYGDKWQYKVNLAEQLYLMMKRNLGNNISCDDVEPLMQ